MEDLLSLKERKSFIEKISFVTELLRWKINVRNHIKIHYT
jgi:hypothetical protein